MAPGQWVVGSNPIRVIGGSRQGIQPQFLLCSKDNSVPRPAQEFRVSHTVRRLETAVGFFRLKVTPKTLPLLPSLITSTPPQTPLVVFTCVEPKKLPCNCCEKEPLRLYFQNQTPGIEGQLTSIHTQARPMISQN